MPRTVPQPAFTFEDRLRAETKVERQRLEGQARQLASELAAVRRFEHSINPQSRPRRKRPRR